MKAEEAWLLNEGSGVCNAVVCRINVSPWDRACLGGAGGHEGEFFNVNDEVG